MLDRYVLWHGCKFISEFAIVIFSFSEIAKELCTNINTRVGFSWRVFFVKSSLYALWHLYLPIDYSIISSHYFLIFGKRQINCSLKHYKNTNRPCSTTFFLKLICLLCIKERKSVRCMNKCGLRRRTCDRVSTVVHRRPQEEYASVAYCILLCACLLFCYNSILQ